MGIVTTPLGVMRLKAGFASASAAAEALQITRSYLTQLEAGMAEPGPGLLARMASTYQVGLSEVGEAVTTSCRRYSRKRKHRIG